MNVQIKRVFEEAQGLTPAEREELAELLLATIDVDPEVEKVWALEVADRVAAHERGDMTTREATEVLSKHLPA